MHTAQISQVQLSDRLLSCPFGSTTGVWSRQCRLPWRFRMCSSWPWLTCPSLCSDRFSGPNSAELCLEAHSCSSWARLLMSPLFSTTNRGADCGLLIVPQIMEEIGKGIQFVHTTVEQIVASCHRSWRKTCPLFATTRTHCGPDISVLGQGC